MGTAKPMYKLDFYYYCYYTTLTTFIDRIRNEIIELLFSISFNMIVFIEVRSL